MAIAKKRKKFFEIKMPLIGKATQAQAYEIEELNDKHIKYDLTRILRGISVMLQMKVSVENGKAEAKPRGMLLLQYFLRRMIRKGTNYVEDSFSVKCKDAQVRIKPFLITRRKVSRAVRNALRVKTKEELTKYVADKKAEDLFNDVLSGKIQKELSMTLKKIYPLSLCEIRILKIEKDL